MYIILYIYTTCNISTTYAQAWRAHHAHIACDYYTNIDTCDGHGLDKSSWGGYREDGEDENFLQLSTFYTSPIPPLYLSYTAPIPPYTSTIPRTQRGTPYTPYTLYTPCTLYTLYTLYTPYTPYTPYTNRSEAMRVLLYVEEAFFLLSF